MHVHLTGWMQPPDLPAGATMSQGGEPPEEATHYVDGRAEDAWLDRPALQAVIVPWAGIPDSLARQMEARPRLALYNLHVNAQAVAELALGLLLDAARGISSGDRALRQGTWLGAEAFAPNVKLQGLTACLLGFGAIGRALEPMVKALGMKAVKVRRRPEGPDEFSLDQAEEALRLSHALLVSLPLSRSTEGWVTLDRLMLLREPRLVVNVGRGPLIDEDGLYEFLKGGRGAAGLDVWHRYPQEGEKEGGFTPSRHPLGELPNVVMSPHRGGWTTSAEADRAQGVAEILSALAEGREWPKVDPAHG